MFFIQYFIIVYMLLILLMINPFVFGLESNKGTELLLLSVFFLTVFFPLLGTTMMKLLGFIEDFKMEDRRDRIAPLVISGVFYLWLFVNIKGNPGIPLSFSFFVLGATIALFVSLMFNSFTRISLHAVSAGGFLTSLFLIRYSFAYSTFIVDFQDFTFIVNTNLILYAAIIITGLIGSARLLLKSHTSSQVFLGYIVGIVSQIIAFRIFIM